MITTRVLEVDRAALRVGQPAVVEDLEQDVEDVRVRLLDLVEQEHRVRPPADRLGQLARLLVADVAGRSADEPGDRVPLLELAHVEADHRVLVAEQRLGERPRQLGLADPGRAEEQEAADRPVRVAQPGRERRTASATASTASSWPTIRSCSCSSSFIRRSRSSCVSWVTGIPVRRDTTSAMSSAVTSAARWRALAALLELARAASPIWSLSSPARS